MAKLGKEFSKKLAKVRIEILECRNMLYEMQEMPQADNAPADGGPSIEDAEYIQPRTPEEDCADAQVILAAAQDLVAAVCPPL